MCTVPSSAAAGVLQCVLLLGTAVLECCSVYCSQFCWSWSVAVCTVPSSAALVLQCVLFLGTAGAGVLHQVQLVL